MDKNYIDTTDLTIVEPAISYFSKHKQKDYYAESLFYKGRVFQNADDNESAIIYFNNALSAVSPDNHSLRDLIHTYIGTAFNLTSNPHDELIHKKIAYEESLLTGNKYNIDNNKYVLAVAYHNCLQFDMADSLIMELLSDDSVESWISAEATLLMARNCIEREKPDYASAILLFSSAIEDGANIQPEEFYEYEYALAKCGIKEDFSEMNEYLDSFGDNQSTLWWKSQISLLDGNYELAATQALQHVENTKKFVSDALAQSLIRQEKMYHKQRSEEVIRKHQSSVLVFLTIIIALLFLALIVVSLSYLSFSQSHRRIAKLEDALISTRELMQIHKVESDDKLRRTKVEFFKSYQKHLAGIEMYCLDAIAQTRMGGKNINETKPLADMVSAIIGGEDSQERLETLINADLDNIVALLRQDYAGVLSNEDICLFCYLILGLSNRTIAFLFDIPDGTQRSRKFRLRSKIQSKQCENRYLYDLFL